MLLLIPLALVLFVPLTVFALLRGELGRVLLGHRHPCESLRRELLGHGHLLGDPYGLLPCLLRTGRLSASPIGLECQCMLSNSSLFALGRLRVPGTAPRLLGCEAFARLGLCPRVRLRLGQRRRP